MGPKKKSSVRQFFNKIVDKKSKCALYQKNIKSTGNTTSFIGHIRNIHWNQYTFNSANTTEETLNPLNAKDTPT